MGEVKHTPGPWVISPLSEMIFSADMGDHQKPIGFIYGPAFAERSEVGRTAMANAVLCAAAPDMLAELKRMVHAYVLLLESGRDRITALGGDCDPVDVMEAGNPHLIAAKAAIAKAEGRP